MPAVKNNELILAIRMRELCRPPSAWNRSLWSVSALTALREVLEASKVRRTGILSDASLSSLQHTTTITIGKDPGVGDERARRYLQLALSGKAVVTPGSLAAATIDQAAFDLESNYLPRWAAFIDSQGVNDSLLEQCARCVVSHLFNLGHSRESITDRIRNAVLASTSSITTAGGLIRDLQSLAAQPSVEFQAVFPVISAPISGKTKSSGWLHGADLVEWMKKQAIPNFHTNERVSGAVTFKVKSPDRTAAEQAAAARFVTIRDRAMLGARHPIASLGYFWLSGASHRVNIEPPNRGVEVASISRQDKIYSSDDTNPSIDRLSHYLPNSTMALHPRPLRTVGRRWSLLQWGLPKMATGLKLRFELQPW